MTTKSKIAFTVIALIVGIVVGYVAFHRSTIPSPAKQAGAGDSVEVVPVTFVNGLSSGDRFSTHKTIKMNTGVNQIAWQNNTGRRVYVSNFFATPTGTTTSATYALASSTLKLSVGTSTTATVTDSASSPVYGSLIDSLSIATSTYVFPQLVYNSFKNEGANGVDVIPVENGQYLIAVLFSPAYGNSCCEAATSTVRGYNFNFDFNYSYF